jgi:elongation factor P
MAKNLVATSLRIGNIVEYDGYVYKVEEINFARKGRDGSVKLDLKNIKTNSQKNLSVNVDVKFNIVEVEEEEFDFMYDDGDSLYTMDGDAFPVRKVSAEILELIPQAERFRVVKLNDEIWEILLPKEAKVKIQNTEPTLKGQTASSSYKPATLSNGWVIQVPVFIEENDEVIIDTTDLTYIAKHT